jgi:hypothetical protein
VAPPDAREQSPEELAADQRRREQVELRRAAEAVDEDDVREHERRAEKADYLRAKLEQQADSERDAGG